MLDLHFNSTAVAEKYLAMHDNMAAMQESMVGVTSEQETRKVFLGCSQQLYALIALEVDRLERVVRRSFCASTFSSTAWRPYGGAKGLVVPY